jgi:hypothetical protein
MLMFLLRPDLLHVELIAINLACFLSWTKACCATTRLDYYIILGPMVLTLVLVLITVIRVFILADSSPQDLIQTAPSTPFPG